MAMNQCLRRVGFSLIVVSALLTGCEDDGDPTTGDDSQAQDAGTPTGSSETTPRAGRTGGRAGSSAAGRAAEGGRGGATATTGGQGGRRSNQGGSGAAGAGGRGGTEAGSGGTAGAADDDAGVAIIELDDGQIAEIANVVNTGEVALGTLALNRATLPAAREYAQSMITLHTAAQDRQAALLSTLGVTPTPSSLSERLTEDATAIRATLESADDASFDLLYIRSQVDLHARVLATIDEQLVPNVTAEELRAELVLTRAEVATHLEEAQTILATLEVGDADAGVP